MASKPNTKRRGYGTGSLRQQGRSWVGSWYGPDGRKVQRKVGAARTPGERDGMTRAQAERELARMRQADAIVIATTSRATMQEAGEALCRALEIRARKKSHRLTVASDLRKHIVPFFEGKDLARIAPEDIERYIAVKTKKLATKTVRNHLNTMHSVFEIGLRRRWCQTNPVKLADRPAIKKNETRIQFLDQAELDKLLANSYPDDAFGRIEPTIYLTAAMTGLRQGELIGLRWRDVDLKARRVRVVSPFVRGEFGDPKSEGSGRSVPLAERVASELERHRERSAYATDGALVFCHPETGHPLDRSKLAKRFKKATRRAEVRAITYHELRHTFGTRMAAAGVPLRTLQQWMGHADSKTTQIYAHYQPAENEAEVVDRAFAPPQNERSPASFNAIKPDPTPNP
jgi:integrase